MSRHVYFRYRQTHTLDRSSRLFSRPIVSGEKENDDEKYMNDKIGGERLLIISITMIFPTKQQCSQHQGIERVESHSLLERPIFFLIE